MSRWRRISLITFVAVPVVLAAVSGWQIYSRHSSGPSAACRAPIQTVNDELGPLKDELSDTSRGISDSARPHVRTAMTTIQQHPGCFSTKEQTEAQTVLDVMTP